MSNRVFSLGLFLLIIALNLGCSQSVTPPVKAPTRYVPPTLLPTDKPTKYVPPSVTPYIPPTVPASPTAYIPPAVTATPILYYTYEIDYNNSIEIKGGGGEGGNEMYISCPTGYVATGLFGGSGAYIDRIGLQCGWLEQNGTTGNILITEMYGGEGGSEFSIVCPVNQLLNAIVGGAGVYVDRIGGHCESVDESYSSDSMSTGGSGGNPFAANCPVDYFVTGIHGRAGVWIDQLNFVCNKINKISNYK